MQVSKWGNSLAVRIPAAVVEAMNLRAGDQIEIRVADERTFELSRAPNEDEVLARIRSHRGRLPRGFRFDRVDAHGRG